VRAPFCTLLLIFCIAASHAGAEDWRIGLGPEVLAELGEAPATRIGGWLDASYEDSSERPAAGGFNHVNLFADTRWRSLQLFVEGEYEHERSLDGYEKEHQIELEQAYLRWQANDTLSLRAGRFNTPFGWWVPIHWSILMDPVTPPLYVGTNVVPEQQIGLELAGRHFPRDIAGLDSELDWSLFAGYGNRGLDQESHGISEGGDLRLWLAQRFLLGASAYRQRNAELENRTEYSGVLYGEAQLPFALTLRSEYVYSHRESIAELARNAESVYAALRWDAHRLLYLAYRYGYGDQDDTEALTTYQRGTHTFTLGILPRPDVRVKLEYDLNHLSGDGPPDFDYWAVSVGYLF
jgi:hypothetical protein